MDQLSFELSSMQKVLLVNDYLQKARNDIVSIRVSLDIYKQNNIIEIWWNSLNR
jgi:hypothetical protein